jgi:DNA replication regulator SLD3
MMLLPRELLSLSYLDLTSPSGDLPSSRHFQSHIRILDLEGRLGSNILIARSPSSNSSSSSGFSNTSSIFAIEREDAGLYVLCKLGSWVDITKLGQHATAVCQQRMPATSTALAKAKSEEPALITPQAYKERGKKRLAIAELQSIVRRRPASQVVTDTDVATRQVDELPSPLLETAEDPRPTSEIPTEHKDTSNDLPARPPDQSILQNKASSLKPAALPTPPASDATKRSSTEPTLPVDVEPAGPPTAEDIFQNIRNQYFEALYHSLVCNYPPLGYFLSSDSFLTLCRAPWRTLQKVLSLVHVPLSTWTATPTLRWTSSLTS